MSDAQPREEYEYEKERKKQRKPVRQKSGVFGKILCLFLGLFLGVAGTIGGVVGVGYWVYTRPMRKTITTVDKFVDKDLYALLFGSPDENGTLTGGYLSEAYAEKTVKQLLGDVKTAAKALSEANGTLGKLNDISPKVGEGVDALLESLTEYNIPVTREGLLTTPLKAEEGETDLKTYFENALMSTAAGDFFSAVSGDDLSPMLSALCYGEENVHYIKTGSGEIIMLGNAKKTTLGEIVGASTEKLTDKIPVDAVMKIKPTDPILCTLAYGAEYRYTATQSGVTMNPIVYDYQIVDGVVKFYEYTGEELVCTATELIPSFYTLSVPTGEKNEDGSPVLETQYAELGTNGKACVYQDPLKTKPLRYKKITVGQLHGESKKIIDEIYLKDALDVTAKSHKVLISLAYGEYDVDYTIVGTGDNAIIQPKTGGKPPRTIGQLRKDSNGLINGVQLSDFIKEKRDDSVIMYLLYGRKGVHYTVNPETDKVEMLQRRIAVFDGQVYNEYGEPFPNGCILDETNGKFIDENGVSYAYSPSEPFDTLTITVNKKKETALLYYVSDEKGKPVRYEKTTLGGMSGDNNLLSKLVERLTASEVLGEQKDLTFFKHVKDETLINLPAAIENLTVQQVFETDIYKSDKDGNFLDEDGNITTDMNARVLNPEWWYLLHNEEDCHKAGHTDSPCSCISNFKLTEMSKLISDMKENVHLATLQQLSDDGMMKFTDGTLGSELKNELRYGKDANDYVPIRIKVKTESGTEYKTAAEIFSDRNGDGKLTVGEMTVEEMISYVDGVISAIDTLNLLMSNS